ncbi:MAG: hypothetical protein AB1798_12070, partial [Spirochaetota bacterium]
KSVKARAGLKFRVYSENRPLKREPYSLKKEEKLYLNETSDGITITGEQNKDTFAQLSSKDKALKFTIIDDRKIPAGEKIPDNLLGGSVRVRGKFGGYVSLQFKEA